MFNQLSWQLLAIRAIVRWCKQSEYKMKDLFANKSFICRHLFSGGALPSYNNPATNEPKQF
jgi:hypothetical protein